MGIKQYCKWLLSLNCNLSCDDNYKYDYVYIDMQHILHINIHYSDNEEIFFNNVKTDLYYLISNYMATRKYILCFDGPAPYAKMLLQKKRRMVTYKEIIDQCISNGIGSNEIVNEIGSNEIVNEIGSNEIVNEIGSNGIGSNEIVNEIGSNEIVNEIGSNEIVNEIANPDLTTNNISLDSDTDSIALSDTISIDDNYDNLYFDKKYKSLNLTPGMPFMDKIITNIKKFVESLKFKFLKTEFEIVDSNIVGEGEIKVFNELIKNNKDNYKHLVICNDADVIIISMATQIKNIYVLIKYQESHILYPVDQIINKIIIDKMKLTLNDYPYDHIRYDIAFLSILLGNDYLPKVNLISIDNIWEIYAKIFLLHINYKFSNNKKEITKYETFFKSYEPLTFNNYMISCFFKEYTKTKKINKYKKNFSYNNFITILPSLSNYVEGLLWCLDMYKNGKYTHHYYINDTRTPNPLELYTYFNYFDKPINCDNKDIYLEPNHKIYPLLVLPYFARKITYEYQNIVFKKLSFLNSEEFCNTCSKLNTINEIYKGKLLQAKKEMNNIIDNEIDKITETDITKKNIKTNNRKTNSKINKENETNKDKIKLSKNISEYNNVITENKKKMQEHKKKDHTTTYTKEYIHNVIKYCNELVAK
ncbi:XRN 5'-3' exonuclease [Hokovirus HKV1]|uniref:XRN 5'-3' exonuclease n=1 Tax=Hokovirus HKV1 TaxID=1977638 RepID=A0A1V0SHC0_9VIRU|nr:XRN 5'-3' exonuclease [Hokovirus HKV1]